MPPPGVYVHIPFCRRRCPYCDFNVLTGADRPLMSRYVEALLAELERVAAAGPRAVAPPHAQVPARWPAFGSIFIGGGTPTRLEAAQLAAVIEHTRALLPVAAGAEVTVEANPEDVNADDLAPLVAAGLNRLSIGAQSAAAGVLRFLGRNHDPGRARRAVATARAAGVASVSVDLIYGAPVETDADWRASLAAALDAGVDHVSCYGLTLEPNTPYATAVRRGEQPAPDDDVAADRMAVAEAVLAHAGFRCYEISNWARPGHEARHNRVYWSCGDYLGVGAGAHGHWAGRRWWNVRPTERYVARVLAGGDARAGEEVLDADARRLERLLLGLRTAEGVPRALVEPIDDQALADLAAAGLVTADGARILVTPEGRPLAGAVARALA